MKAIRVHEFGDPEVMKLEEIEEPIPGKGEVIVKIHAAGVNPVDTYIRSGLYPLKPLLPYTPGIDGAGIVESIGEGVSRMKIGDRVYISGAISGSYAEKALCKESQVYPLPENVSFKQGAAMGIPYATAYYALFNRAKALPDETVLVHGASGGVGIAAVQIARASGMRVIGTAGTEKGIKLVTEQGANYVFDHNSPDYLKEIHRITDSKGVDVILEMLANVNLGKDLTILSQNGRVVVIGSRGTVEIDPRNAMIRNASILGMLLMNASKEEILNIHESLRAGLEKGTLNPVIGREYPLSEAFRAHHEIIESKAYGKIVLIP